MNWIDFKGLNKKRIIAASLSIIIAIVLSYLIYASEYKFTNDKDDLSAAITEYTSNGRYSVEAYVLETKEVDSVLIAFFKDKSNADVYGFARLSKGFNQKYRLIRANFSPSKYTSLVKAYEFETSKGVYYAIGGHNLDSNVTAYGLEFKYGDFDNTDNSQWVQYDISNSQFIDLHKKSSIQNLLSMDFVENDFYLNPFHVALLDSEGQDITEEYKKVDPQNSTWSAGTGTAELFMINVFMAIVLIFGLIMARYFLTD